MPPLRGKSTYPPCSDFPNHLYQTLGSNTYIKPIFPRGSKISIGDFACGIGTVAQEVLNLSTDFDLHITKMVLMDVVDVNLEAANAQLKPFTQDLVVENLRLNGNNFSNHAGDKVDFLYCWDAMVHIDVIDVFGYIKSFKNICNGYALFHHSNLSKPTVDIRVNPHWRNFMTKGLFW